MLRQIALLSSTVVVLAGCAVKPPVVAVAPPPVVAPVPVAAMPAGGYPGMTIPAALPDGSYPTPNRALTPAATVWHLRVALNVAALACRGPEATALVANYNGLLTAQKAVLARAESDYAAQMKATGDPEWRDRYDDAMTRLYNFFSQSPARARFCANATAVLADSAAVPAAGWATFAAARLPDLDAPFTDFYRAYDAWRSQAPMPMMGPEPRPMRPVIALAATAAPGPVTITPASPPVSVAPASIAPIREAPVQAVAPTQTPVIQTARAMPRIEVDPAVFQLP